MKTLHQLYSFVSSALFSSENRESVSACLLTWVDSHARSRFARSTIREKKWGTTRNNNNNNNNNNNKAFIERG